jgi:excinuclease UvrABC ATPase subunit
VFTGVSGSRKSSLAFGTLYGEAQRRYLESVAPYARRLFHQMDIPQVDSIDGLPPAVALQQQRGSPTTRSSVGSVTTNSNLLRMLYSRAGDCPRGQSIIYAEGFSPNTPEGACPICHGDRYNAKTLEIRYRGKNIAEILRLTVDAAHSFFEGEPALFGNWLSCSRWDSGTSASDNQRQNSQAAKLSASSSQPNCSGQSEATRFTCSMNRPQAFIHSTSKS